MPGAGERLSRFRSQLPGGLRVPAAEIDQIIKDEIETARDNTKQHFEMHTVPRA
jgi:hypothetical protein